MTFQKQSSTRNKRRKLNERNKKKNQINFGLFVG